MQLLYDDRYRGFALVLAAEYGLAAAPLREATLKDDGALVIMDLTDAQSLQTVRRLLASGAIRGELNFLMDPRHNLYRQEVQANALGSRRNIRSRDLRAWLTELHSDSFARSVQTQRTELLTASATGRHILSAANGMRALFETVGCGGRIELSDVDAIADAVHLGLEVADWSTWLDMVQNHHEGTFQHCLTVAGIADHFARHSEEDAIPGGQLVQAAILHDIGKSHVPVAILDKTGPLSPSEWQAIKAHPRAGIELLSGTPGISEEVRDAILHHHEALDGSGYPDGLAGAEISEMTRMLTVCDVFAALIEKRAYKPAMTTNDAITKLAELAFADKVDFRHVRRLARCFDVRLAGTVAAVLGADAARY